MYICISSSRYVLTHALFLPCKSRRCRQRLQGYVVPVVKILRLGGVCLLDSGTVNMFIYVQDSKMGYKYNTRIVKSSAVGFFFLLQHSADVIPHTRFSHSIWPCVCIFIGHCRFIWSTLTIGKGNMLNPTHLHVFGVPENVGFGSTVVIWTCPPKWTKVRW